MKSEATLRSHEFSRMMKAAHSEIRGIPRILQQWMQENMNKNFGRKVSSFFHSLWRHLVTYMIRDAKAVVPVVQPPVPALICCCELAGHLLNSIGERKKVAHEARGRQLILLRVIHPQNHISPTCQRMDPEDHTITWKHFMIISTCKYFLLSLHLAQICTNNLEVSSYYILLPNVSDSALFLFTATVHGCFHSPLKMPI